MLVLLELAWFGQFEIGNINRREIIIGGARRSGRFFF